MGDLKKARLEELKKLKDQNRVIEENLRKNKKRLEDSLREDISTYDESMFGMVNKIRQKELKYDQEKKNLKELEEHFDKIKAEKDRIDRELNHERENNEMWERKLKLKVAAAEWIQAHWRGLKSRKELDKV